MSYIVIQKLQQLEKKIKRAAIRYQNNQAARGNYIPSIEEATREVLKNHNAKATSKKTTT